MNGRIVNTAASLLSLVAVGGGLPVAAQTPQPLDAAAIGAACGLKTQTTPDGVVRIAWARTDLQVKVDGMPLKPFAGLGSWAAFTRAPHGAMVMGDTVVFQDEVSPALDAVLAHGLEVTGLHNHFFYDEPKVYFIHIGGRGEPEKLAAGVKAVWDAIKRVRAERGAPGGHFAGETPQGGSVTAAPIEKVLGHDCQSQDGVVKVVIGREGTMHGVRVGGSMGLTTWAAFSGSDKLAAVDGDFIMTAVEVQPVLRALRRANIHVVALHNHMVGEQPAFYFTHFWGKGKAHDLAEGVKAALEAQRRAEMTGPRAIESGRARPAPGGPGPQPAPRRGRRLARARRPGSGRAGRPLGRRTERLARRGQGPPGAGGDALGGGPRPCPAAGPDGDDPDH